MKLKKVIIDIYNLWIIDSWNRDSCQEGYKMIRWFGQGLGRKIIIVKDNKKKKRGEGVYRPLSEAALAALITNISCSTLLINSLNRPWVFSAYFGGVLKPHARPGLVILYIWYLFTNKKKNILLIIVLVL